MRTPHNDQLSEPDRAGRRGQHVPERRCVITGEVSPAERLVRLALSPDGDIAPDVLGKAPGRGAWIGVDRGTLEAAQAKPYAGADPERLPGWVQPVLCRVVTVIEFDVNRAARHRDHLIGGIRMLGAHGVRRTFGEREDPLGDERQA